jgi:hypothetical protein
MPTYFLPVVLVHATILAVAGFLIFFAASYAEGRVRLFGNGLGVWLCILSTIALVGGITELILHPPGVCESPAGVWRSSPAVPKLCENAKR